MNEEKSTGIKQNGYILLVIEKVDTYNVSNWQSLQSAWNDLLSDLSTVLGTKIIDSGLPEFFWLIPAKDGLHILAQIGGHCEARRFPYRVLIISEQNWIVTTPKPKVSS